MSNIVKNLFSDCPVPPPQKICLIPKTGIIKDNDLFTDNLTIFKNSL